MNTEKNYIGERFDPETGLLYLNARYMDPKFGRFVETDPETGRHSRFSSVSVGLADQ